MHLLFYYNQDTPSGVGHRISVGPPLKYPKWDLLNKIAFLQSHEARRHVSSILGLISLFNWEERGYPFNAIVLEKMLAATEELDRVIHRTIDTSSLDLT